MYTLKQHKFNEVLESLRPFDPKTSGADGTGLAILIQIEERIREMKSQRTKLEEHLAHLNRIHAERSSRDSRKVDATRLLSQRVWELEVETAAFRSGGGRERHLAAPHSGGSDGADESLAADSEGLTSFVTG